jgi:arginine decarboxylase
MNRIQGATTVNLVAKKLFFTRGVGTHKAELRSFELALRDAGVEKQNLVTVSSILPPNCKIVSKNEGMKLLKPGEITFCVMARSGSNEPHRLCFSSIGVAVPTNKNSYGYLSEHHGFGQTDEQAGEFAEDLAAAMLASTLGVEFDEDHAWDEKKEVFRMSNKIVKTKNVTQSAVVRNGHTTTVALAVFIF